MTGPSPTGVPPRWRIRQAGRDDSVAVLELWRAAGATPTVTDDQEGLEALARRDPGALLVADSGERLVGSVIAAWDGWRGSIYRLAVHPDLRRRGLGRDLLGAAKHRLVAAGARRLQAVVETDEGALGYWRTSGWHEQTARLRFVRAGSTGEGR